MRGGSGGARAGEGLGKTIRSVGAGEASRAAAVQIAAESLEAIENVSAREIAREEVGDLVYENIQASFDGVAPADKRDCIANLAAVNVGEPRAEEIPADNEIRDPTLTDGGFRIDAVSQAGLVVACKGGPRFVDYAG